MGAARMRSCSAHRTRSPSRSEPTAQSPMRPPPAPRVRSASRLTDRWPSTWTCPRTSAWPRSAACSIRPMAAESTSGEGDPGRLTVIALAGIPAIQSGDDLGGLIAAAIERLLAGEPGFGPLRRDDVIVVTQKVVSKAEGAIVDLTSIVPRPEALT